VHKLAPSCCRLIVFEQSAKSTLPTHPCVSGKRRPREVFLLRCLELQRTVRSQAVVMTNVDREDVLGWRLEKMSSQSRHSVLTVRIHRSQMALARGALMGVQTTAPPGRGPEAAAGEQLSDRRCRDLDPEP
jgi:hypothetical protein